MYKPPSSHGRDVTLTHAKQHLQRAREVRRAGELVAGYLEVEQERASPSGTRPENWLPDSKWSASGPEEALLRRRR
jgi:hypothetical protein